jgi:hypothetical protein
VRVAVVGDIGGHATELRAELTRLGEDKDGRLPSDLVVIQVGDLIHRGPDSDDVVKLVDNYLKPNRTSGFSSSATMRPSTSGRPRSCGPIEWASGRIAPYAGGGRTVSR